MSKYKGKKMRAKIISSSASVFFSLATSSFADDLNGPDGHGFFASAFVSRVLVPTVEVSTPVHCPPSMNSNYFCWQANLSQFPIFARSSSNNGYTFTKTYERFNSELQMATSGMYTAEYIDNVINKSILRLQEQAGLLEKEISLLRKNVSDLSDANDALSKRIDDLDR